MTDADTTLQQEVAVSLLTHLHKVVGDVVFGPIVKNGQISDEKLHKPRWDFAWLIGTFLTSGTCRMRAQVLLEGLMIEGQAGHPEDNASILTEMEVKRCATVIAAAFLNPSELLANLLCWEGGFV